LEHQRDAVFGAANDGFGNDIGRVTGHGAGVAEAKVDVFAAVNVDEMRAFADLTKMGNAPAHFSSSYGDTAE